MEFDDIVLLLSLPDLNKYIFPDLSYDSRNKLTELSIHYVKTHFPYFLGNKYQSTSPFKRNIIEKNYLHETLNINSIIAKKINKIKFILGEDIEHEPKTSTARYLLSDEIRNLSNLNTNYINNDIIEILIKLGDIGWMENGLNYIDSIDVLESSTHEWSRLIYQKYFDLEFNFPIIFNSIFQDAKEISYLYFWQQKLCINNYIYILGAILEELKFKFSFNDLEIEKATLIFKYW